MEDANTSAHYGLGDFPMQPLAIQGKQLALIVRVADCRCRGDEIGERYDTMSHFYSKGLGVRDRIPIVPITPTATL